MICYVFSYDSPKIRIFPKIFLRSFENMGGPISWLESGQLSRDHRSVGQSLGLSSQRLELTQLHYLVDTEYQVVLHARHTNTQTHQQTHHTVSLVLTQPLHPRHPGVSVAQRLGRRTSDQAVVGSIPGRGVIRAPRSTQPSIPPG